MKAYITENGVELFAENETEGFALRYLLPPGWGTTEAPSRITVHMDPKTLRDRERGADE